MAGFKVHSGPFHGLHCVKPTYKSPCVAPSADAGSFHQVETQLVVTSEVVLHIVLHVDLPSKKFSLPHRNLPRGPISAYDFIVAS